MSKLIIVLITLGFKTAFAGPFVSGGDPTPITLPSQNFTYQCAILTRGNSAGSPFYWANRTIEFSRQEFKLNSSHSSAPPLHAIASYVTTDDGSWKISDHRGQQTNQLPSLLQNQKIELILQEGSNVGMGSSGLVISLVTELKPYKSSGAINGNSSYVPFYNSSVFSVDISYTSEDGTNFIGMSVDCQRLIN